MSTQDNILSALPRLSVEERALVAKALSDLGTSRDASSESAVGGMRTPGLHAGAWKASADLDASLPDKFWLGDDA